MRSFSRYAMMRWAIVYYWSGNSKFGGVCVRDFCFSKRHAKIVARQLPKRAKVLKICREHEWPYWCELFGGM